MLNIYSWFLHPYVDFLCSSVCYFVCIRTYSKPCFKKCQHGIKYIISNWHKTEYKECGNVVLCSHDYSNYIHVYDLVFPFHTPVSWAVLKRLARWMFKHSSDIIQLHSVNTQHWHLVSMSISMSDVLTSLQAPKQCSCHKQSMNLSFSDS
jgi:hypothetical protein